MSADSAAITAVANALVSGNHLPNGSPFPGFDHVAYVEVNGDPTQSGADPAAPSTLESVLTNHQVENLLVILGVGTHSTPTAFDITSDNVTLQGRLGGYQAQTTALTGPLNLTAGVTRFQAFGLRFNSDINDLGSDGRHRFVECGSGAITYLRTSPRNFLEFLDSSMPGCDYTVSGSGNGGTAGGADTFMTGASDLGSISVSTSGHYFKTRHGSTSKQISAPNGSSPIFVLEGFVINGTDSVGVSLPTGSLIAQNCRFNQTGVGLAAVDVNLHWFADVLYRDAGSSVGGIFPGLGATEAEVQAGNGGASQFSRLAYTAADPNDWGGNPPTTVAEALDRLASMTP